VQECELLISQESDMLKNIHNYKSKMNQNGSNREQTESLIFSQNNLSFKFIQNVSVEYLENIYAELPLNQTIF